LVVRDYNADEKIDWHDYYLEALTPVQTVSIKRKKLAEQQATMLKQNNAITEQIEKLTEEIHIHLGLP
jgi:hypothetical protein